MCAGTQGGEQTGALDRRFRLIILTVLFVCLRLATGSHQAKPRGPGGTARSSRVTRKAGGQRRPEPDVLALLGAWQTTVR